MTDDTDAATALHGVLLRLAGLVPDDVLTGLRSRLGDNDLAGVGRTATDVARALSVPLTDEDVSALRLVTPQVPDPVNSGATATAPPYSFMPALADPAVFGGAVPPLLDLTTAPESFGRAVTDDVDVRAVQTLSHVTRPVALWRAWRVIPGGSSGAPTRVYLVEADLPAGDLAGATAAMMRDLAAAGHEPPLVEVYPTGAALPAYHRLARGAAALLWTAEDLPPVRVARVFDRVDPETGPRFDDGHERLDGAERERVLAWLDGGLSILATTERMGDILDPSTGPVVPMSYRTDGRWVWTDTVGYYLRGYGLAPDPELLAHIRAVGHVVAGVDAVGEHRALATLFQPAPATPAGRR